MPIHLNFSVKILLQSFKMIVNLVFINLENQLVTELLERATVI